ncbi:hypothetical protein NPIL_510361 [Nephila pilipes]|uniref:Uncharacterized protein n=1 Tax=Nephila pilipes TaxID=299642 RepID=A0A8X6QH59_NEPPI|nr:hypothetical protein NPIL_510361 [Nephila pilipes]
MTFSNGLRNAEKRGTFGINALKRRLFFTTERIGRQHYPFSSGGAPPLSKLACFSFQCKKKKSSLVSLFLSGRVVSLPSSRDRCGRHAQPERVRKDIPPGRSDDDHAPAVTWHLPPSQPLGVKKNDPYTLRLLSDARKDRFPKEAFA